MATSRYAFSPKILGRQAVSSSKVSYKIYFAVDQGILSYTTRVVQEATRLDHVAGEVYGTSSLWWVIAAASGIGWGLQVPEGTLLRIPSDVSKVFQFVR
jgi:hypothetical protein